jgi:prophage antirepressor-like protein
VQVIKGEPWFVAKDVFEVLGIANHNDAMSRLDQDEKGVGTADTLGGKQQVGIVNESGLYSLVFQSRKPAAVKFRKWVTGEVLPALRKYGQYAVPGSREAAKLEERYRQRERAEWLKWLRAELTTTDLGLIDHRLKVARGSAARVLNGWATDTAIERELVAAATANARTRRLLADADFRRGIAAILQGRESELPINNQ